MGFLSDLIRKYDGGNGCQTLEDLIDTRAEKYLRAWVREGCKGSPIDYAETMIHETHLFDLRKGDQILLAQEYYKEEENLLAKDCDQYGLNGAIEQAARKKVHILIRVLFVELALAGLAIQNELLKFYKKVDIKHQNPFRGLRPIQISERYGFSFFEYPFEGNMVHVYVSDYPYLGFVAKNSK